MKKIILREKNFSRLKEFVKKNKDKKIIFSSDDDDLNRKVMEKLPVDLVLINLSHRKDFLKQRNSGFNEVIARIALKNKVQIGINFDEFFVLSEREKILSRVKQNITLCSRKKIQMQFVIGKEKRSLVLLKSLGLVLGMPTWMTKGLVLY